MYRTNNIKILQGFHVRVHTHFALIAQCAAGNKHTSLFKNKKFIKILRGVRF